MSPIRTALSIAVFGSVSAMSRADPINDEPTGLSSPGQLVDFASGLFSDY